MDYKNKLITGLSLVALAALSACTDDAENGGRTLPGDHSLSFAVSTKSANGWKPANGTRAASGFGATTRELEPVEMQGKVDGQPVYLTTEVVEGFPGDNTPMTRGTQVTENNKGTMIKSFGVSAYMDKDGKPDFMYNEEATLNDDDACWYPGERYLWPTGKELNFYAWYPYGSTENGLTVTGADRQGAPTLTYEIPREVSDQVDVMTAIATGQSEDKSDPVTGTELTFNHALTAVNFVTGDDLPECTVKSITIKNVKYKGSYTLGADAWDLQDGVRDFSVTIDKETDGTGGISLTGDDQTFFMMPQTFEDENAMIEAVLVIKGQECTLSAHLKEIHLDADTGESKYEMGKTYVYRISYATMSIDVTFFKGVNGTDGNPYTSHNISANGDPFTVDIKYPSAVTAVTARFAYEVTDDSGNITYESIKDDYDLKQEQSSLDFTSPCMNNLGTEENVRNMARKDTTKFVVQIKIACPNRVLMPADPDEPDSPLIFEPGADENTWYTVWRGTMFPPNYILEHSTFSTYIGRENLLYNNSTRANLTNMRTAVNAYWEVDMNHPTFGIGKWGLPSNGQPAYSYVFRDVDNIFETVTFEIMKWSYRGSSPGENVLYGEPFEQKGFYWTNGDNGGGSYWIFCGQNDVNHSSWDFAANNCAGFRRIDYQMTSVSYANSGVCGRGFASTGRLNN